MRYRERTPSAATSVAVARFWTLEVGAATPSAHAHRVIPDGCTDLLVVQRGGYAFVTVRGPRDDAMFVAVEPGDRYVGARLWPDAAATLFDVDPATLVGAQRFGDELVGADAHALAAAVSATTDADAGWDRFETWLAPRVASMPPLDQAVRLAILAITASDGALPVGELADAVALGPRQLQRRFRAATGLTPKTYARIRRLRASLHHLVGGRRATWSEVAASLGFADQPHLIAEFTRLAGGTPSEIEAYIAGIVHEDVVP